MTNSQNLLFADECLFVLNKDLQVKELILCAQSSLQHSEQNFLNTDILSFLLEPERIRFKQCLNDVFTNSNSMEIDAMTCEQNSKTAMYRWKISKQGTELYLLGRERTVEKIDRDTAHEINNSLTVIQTRSLQLQQMADANELSPDKIKNFAVRIHAAAVKITNIIKSAR